MNDPNVDSELLKMCICESWYQPCFIREVNVYGLCHGDSVTLISNIYKFLSKNILYESTIGELYKDTDPELVL